MNTQMWEHPASALHQAQIAEDLHGTPVSAAADALALIDRINAARTALTVVAAVVKSLACDEVGLGAKGWRRSDFSRSGEISIDLRFFA